MRSVSIGEADGTHTCGEMVIYIYILSGEPLLLLLFRSLNQEMMVREG
jgi:hypothetical protein